MRSCKLQRVGNEKLKMKNLNLVCLGLFDPNNLKKLAIIS